MTATEIRPAARLTPLVAGIRSAVERHADWAETSPLVADQLRRHLRSPDVLTGEQPSAHGRLVRSGFTRPGARTAAWATNPEGRRRVRNCSRYVTRPPVQAAAY